MSLSSFVPAFVVYGFASYGLFECLDRLTRSTDTKHKAACEAIDEKIREMRRAQAESNADPA